jgi:hypothetical protein
VEQKLKCILQLSEQLLKHVCPYYADPLLPEISHADRWIQQGSVAACFVYLAFNTARMINIFKEFMERGSLQRDYRRPDLKYCDSLVSLKNAFIVPQPKKHTAESV